MSAVQSLKRAHTCTHMHVQLRSQSFAASQGSPGAALGALSLSVRCILARVGQGVTVSVSGRCPDPCTMNMVQLCNCAVHALLAPSLQPWRPDVPPGSSASALRYAQQSSRPLSIDFPWLVVSLSTFHPDAPLLPTPQHALDEHAHPCTLSRSMTQRCR